MFVTPNNYESGRNAGATELPFNDALIDLKHGRIQGSAVLEIDDALTGRT